MKQFKRGQTVWMTVSEGSPFRMNERVKVVRGENSNGWVYVKNMTGEISYFLTSQLTHTRPVNEIVRTFLNKKDGCTISVGVDGCMVGCQSISWDKFDEIQKMRKELNEQKS